VTRRALLVSTANPYPVVKDGCERLVHDYVGAMFPTHEMHFLHATAGDWSPRALYRDGRPVDGDVDLPRLLDHDYAFVVFVGFKSTAFTRELAASRPSFCYSDTFPHPDVPGGLFRGILSHRGAPADGGDDVLLVGGSFDDDLFRPQRRDEDIVLAVGRIHPDKNQLELVSRYRDAIFEPYGLPLHLVGGASDPDYYDAVAPFVDGVAVVSSIVDPRQPAADANWRSARQIAALCNRARLFVSASPREAFGLALVEALACGTTCVVNGDYRGFAEADLRPRVHGNVTARRGSIVDLVAEALRDDVRIDASQWARRYAMPALRDAVTRFVDDRV